MSERQAFLDEILEPMTKAVTALLNGDAGPWRSMWSKNDPVTVAGAMVPLSNGWEDASATFEYVAGLYQSSDELDFELVAAGACGGLAYTYGIERSHSLTTAGTVVDSALRVTHVYRREPEGWRIVHRHGDHLFTDPRSGEE